jgi:hypothetical protein
MKTTTTTTTPMALSPSRKKTERRGGEGVEPVAEEEGERVVMVSSDQP